MISAVAVIATRASKLSRRERSRRPFGVKQLYQRCYHVDGGCYPVLVKKC